MAHIPTATKCQHWNRPGYQSPLYAMEHGPRETIAYVTCISAKWEVTRIPDSLATVDVDPSSPTYSTIIHKLHVPNLGDELHHSNWNVCSSCKDCTAKRNRLIVPAINSDRIYIFDTETNPRAPEIFKILEPSELHEKAKASGPHTTHCTPAGYVQISCLGDEKGDKKGTFVLLDRNTFEFVGTWQREEDCSEYNYDFWYQPRINVMVSTEWAAPNTFRKGFYIEDLKNGLYGHSMTFWNWTTRKQIKTLDLGEKGQLPLEVRFLHNPEATEGFVGCALSSTIFRFYKTENDDWSADCVIEVPPKKVKNWILDEMPSLITDIIVSLDDRFLYFSNWLHGDIRQYDISDTKNPRLVGQLFLGGLLCDDTDVEILEDSELKSQPQRPKLKGSPLRGGPQMMQLSLDGKRLYVTNSLFSTWDEQFYPEMVQKGASMILVNVDTEKGGLTLDQSFLVEFGPEGNILAHEMRFSVGDCTSDIWD